MATKYKKQKDGRYQTRIWDGSYNKDGSKHRITIYSDKSSRDLERKVAEFKKTRDSGDLTINTKILFCDYASAWLEACKGVREDGTKIMYQNIINTYFRRLLPTLKLQDIKKIHFQQLITAAKDRPRTCQQISLTFRQVIRYAIDNDLLPERAFKTVCSNIDMPKYISPEKRALTDVEKACVKFAPFEDRDRAFVYILYGCGLRRGEALALTKADITTYLKVSKSVAFHGNTPYLKDTKNHVTRYVPIPDWLRKYLLKYMFGLPGDLLFPSRSGGLTTKSSYDKMWARIIRTMESVAGKGAIVGLTAHIFRHNYCATLCSKIPAISIKKIAELLGDSEKMVLEVYNHSLDKPKQVEDTVDEALAL